MKGFIATIALIFSLTVMSAETSATGPLNFRLIKTVRVGRDVTCETQAASIVTYTCTMKINDSGSVIK